MPGDSFYITTPIYYVNDIPHLGTAYCTIAADTRARFERLRGKDVRFLTGTDENALKVARAAEAEGKDVQAFVDELAERFKATWKEFNISYDDFIRTTEPRHTTVVRRFVEKLHESGDIYLSTYNGWYCVSCETFFTDDELKAGPEVSSEVNEGRPSCPNAECRKDVQWVEEPSYYFRLSAYGDRLIEEIEKRPEFLRPDSRRNEVLSFIRSGLNDVCISRMQTWGIPMPESIPDSQGQVVYVWFDALINYVSATGYLSENSDAASLFDRYWPCDVHLVGKDIFVRFHATFWPAILMALGIAVPRTVFGHGFWNIEGEKMSKSKGNVIEPVQLARDLAKSSGCEFQIAVDAMRYCLLREVAFGADGDFRRAGLIGRFNAELANDLGNLLNRSLSMLHRYRDGKVSGNRGGDSALRSVCEAALPEVGSAYADMNFIQALARINEIVNEANRHIEREAPWEKSKRGENESLDFLLTELLDTLQFVTVALAPLMPTVTQKIWEQLGEPVPFTELRWQDATRWGDLSKGHTTRKPEPIFPRIDKTDVKGSAKTVEQPPSTTDPQPSEKPTITFAEFQKMELRTAKILTAEKVKGADKLLQLTVDLGTEQRTVVAGIAQQFSPEEILGKTVVIVANLEPAKIRGIQSQGMILAAGGEVPLALITPDRDVPTGAKVR
ncbi:MAG: methionine--tRNA ligase [Armatimonadetes bacterium]|nr:methionine--tRNA ligase [Armatimonadota bacterium]